MFTHVTVAFLFGELVEVCVHIVPGVGWIGVPPRYVDVSFRNEAQLEDNLASRAKLSPRQRSIPAVRQADTRI